MVSRDAKQMSFYQFCIQKEVIIFPLNTYTTTICYKGELVTQFQDVQFCLKSKQMLTGPQKIH